MAKFKEKATLNEKGQEVPDPKVMAPPIGWMDQPDMFELMRQMIRSEQLRREAEEAGMETFEEADDFDVEDDMFPVSPYENDLDTPLDELKRRAAAGEKVGYDDHADRAIANYEEKVSEVEDGADGGVSPKRTPPPRSEKKPKDKSPRDAE